MPTGNVLQELRGRLKTFLAAKEGNIAIMFALTLIPVLILIGIGINYALDSKLKAELDTFADSAALALLSPTMSAPGERRNPSAGEEAVLARGSSEWRAPHFEAPACYLTRVRLFAGGTGIGLLDHVQNSTEVVALWSLQRRELFVGQKVPLPQLLANGQHVPVVLEGRHWGGGLRAR